MVRKIFSVLLLTAVTNAFAMTPIYESQKMASELSHHFDEMNYALNVEWDQKESSFFDATVANFEKEIEVLQEQGLTNEELIDFTLNNIKDKKMQKDLIEITNIVNESNMSAEEAREFVLSKIDQTYAQGTSWSGPRLGLHVALFIGALIIILCISKKKSSKKKDHKPKKCRDHHSNGGNHGENYGCGDNYYT